MVFSTLLAPLFAVRGCKGAPQSAQGRHQGAQSLSLGGQISLTFRYLFLSTCKEGAKASQRGLHILQKTPKVPSRHKKYIKTATRVQLHRQNTELPIAKELHRPSISPEHPKLTKTSRCGGVASAFSVSIYKYICIYTHISLSLYIYKHIYL